MQEKTIAIIGGGFSGTLLAVQLLRIGADIPLTVYLIDKNIHKNLGMAYATSDPEHLLNVPAASMSPFVDDPLHFYWWLQVQGHAFSTDDFVPRYIYGKYMQEVGQNTLDRLKPNHRFHIVTDEAIHLLPTREQTEVILASGESIYCHKAVLALGNFPPAHLRLPESAYQYDGRYYRNPWDKQAFKKLRPEANVLLIGTGLTMIDMVRTLKRREHKGNILAVSRHGQLPLVHQSADTYPSFQEEIEQCTSLTSVLATVKKHLKTARENGQNWMSVIDALRPVTQGIWVSMSLEDKKRFLRHIAHRWTIARHRMPESSAAIIQQMEQTEQLQIKAGRITAITPGGKGMYVQYFDKKKRQTEHFNASLILNCTGPEGNLACIDNLLLKNLLAAGILRNDPLHLGIHATPEGAIISQKGAIWENIFTLGPPMKGTLWECISVPEIRQQAYDLAQTLLQQ
jgi:uncharacterized NAD(P)/FAD-binding protein YdhS